MQTRTDVYHRRTLIPSVPGGLARHWRVQIQPEGESSWRMYAAFSRPEPAEACLHELESRGVRARLLTVRIIPTSA